MRRAALFFSVVFVHNVKSGRRPRDRSQLPANVGVNFSLCQNLQINQDSRKEGKRKREPTFLPTAAPSRAEEANSSLADNATSQELASVRIYSDQPTSAKLLHFLSSETESSPDM